ncbi:MAG: hypothetical protein HY606_01490 [Planctomycetes bacterium]|nr:hypothetical protein [Planctomycetota bacterium]
MTKAPELIFFAYQGRSREQSDINVDAISKAIEIHNEHQKTSIAKSWEHYRKTTAINIEILRAIDTCSVFVCDLTYFNHNVLFELGYAIGRERKILILLNENVADAINKYKEFILKNIRYTKLINAQNILAALQNKDYDGDLIHKFVNLENIGKERTDLLYLQSKIDTQPAIDLTQAIEDMRDKKNFILVTDSPEVSYRPMDWYFQNIVKAHCTIIHLLGTNMANSIIENAKGSFWAGLALGLGSKVILVAPSKYPAPLDYHDILIQYRDSSDLVGSTMGWLNSEIRISGPMPEVEDKQELDLIKLGIGSERAEGEKYDLLNYFIETAPYTVALRQDKTVVIGRKGSGKSAIYIKILSELEYDKLNFVINLRPESAELLEDVELSNLFKSEASKKTFFVTIWRLVIFSKLVQTICNKILQNESKTYASHEEAVIQFVEDHEVFIKKNIFGVVREISERLGSNTDRESPDILQELYIGYLGPAIKLVKRYFELTHTKYYRLVILADNLDQTWDSRYNLDLQAEMITTLLEMDERLKNDLQNNKNDKIEIKHIIFLRTDIFEYIVKFEKKEPDKLTAMAHEINWEEYPELLRRLLDSRFKYTLNLVSDVEIDQTWVRFFKFKSKRHPFDIIEGIITRRPRDLIYFVSRLFEAAVNKGHNAITDGELPHAIESYSKFLNQNLIAETSAEFPTIEGILAKLQVHHGQKLEYKKLSKIIRSYGYDEDKENALVVTLFEKGYMLGFDTKTNSPFSDIETLRHKLKERRWIFFRNKVYVIAHAKYFLIKNRHFSSF